MKFNVNSRTRTLTQTTHPKLLWGRTNSGGNPNTNYLGRVKNVLRIYQSFIIYPIQTLFPISQQFWANSLFCNAEIPYSLFCNSCIENSLFCYFSPKKWILGAYTVAGIYKRHSAIRLPKFLNRSHFRIFFRRKVGGNIPTCAAGEKH